ncbi:MAG: DUF3823 domain-containing protein, partial [Rhodospirillales bacterium]|nr:DUF3823 domain-containing protein [Rhodospirillales bacterium]
MMIDSVAHETFTTVEAGIRRANPSDAVADRRRVRLEERNEAFEDRLFQQSLAQPDARTVQFAPDTFNALLFAGTDSETVTPDQPNDPLAAAAIQSYQHQNELQADPPSERPAEYLLAV